MGRVMKVYLVGVGMGNPDTLTLGAKRAIEESDLLIGAPRLLAPFKRPECRALELIYSSDIVQALESEPFEQASVLLSGDIGFYSGATALYDKLGAFEVESIPGISSVVYFCAKLHTTWQDVTLVSAHGREHDAVGAIQSNAKTFCLTGGKTKVEDICRELVERGLGDVEIAAGERLSYDDERIVRGTARELSEMRFADLAVMVAWNPSPLVRTFGAPALPDSAFERGHAPMTKEEVRALAIAKLRIAPNHVVWDVGAGTGSVTIEAALAANRGCVYAIEKKGDALELLERNRSAHGLPNIKIVAGEAPAALADLPAPDRVFIGGSSGEIGSIVNVAATANPQVRICATAVTIETLSALMECLKDNDIRDADIVQVAVSRADKLGPYHLMRAENPIYLVTFNREGGNA